MIQRKEAFAVMRAFKTCDDVDGQTASTGRLPTARTADDRIEYDQLGRTRTVKRAMLCRRLLHALLAVGGTVSLIQVGSIM